MKKKDCSGTLPRVLISLAGLAGMLLIAGMLSLGAQAGAAGAKPGESVPLPAASSERFTALILGRDEHDEAAVCLLAGILPDRCCFAVSALPENTVWDVGGTTVTLSGAVSSGGPEYAAGLLSQYLGIPIDRTISLGCDGLKTLMHNKSLTYELAEGVSGWVGERRIDYPPGSYRLDARAVADLLAVEEPAFPERRAQRCVSLAAALLRPLLPRLAEGEANTLCRELLAAVRTDLTALDWRSRESAVRLAASRGTVIGVTGRYVVSGGGAQLTDEGLRLLREAFGREAAASGQS